MPLLDKLDRLARTISLTFRLLLLRLALFVRQTLSYRTSPNLSTTRTALLLGDATALGLGDSPANLGLSTRLPALLRAERDATGLRLYWHVVTAGRYTSRARDWAPGAPGALFERAVLRGPFARADVVIVLLGAHDDVAADGPAVVASVARVVEGLVRLGKHAVLATFPNPHPVRSPAHAAVRAANERLRDAVARVREENSAPGCGSVSCDVEMAKVFAMGNEVVRFENDFVGLNGNGYRLLAREVFDALVLSAKKVEWAYWKQKLGKLGAR